MHTLFRQCPTVLQSPESSGLISSQSPHLEFVLRRGIHTDSSSSTMTQQSSADSGSNDSHSQASKPSRWNRSISRPGHTPKSSSKDRCRDETVEPYDAKPMRPLDSTSCQGDLPGGRSKTIWSTDDSFLPRAKPPPPLKRITHQRTRSAANVSSTKQSPLQDRSSMSSRMSSKPSSSKPSSDRLRSWSPSLDMPILDISSEHSNSTADDEQRAFIRSVNRMTVLSETSEVSEICFSPTEFPASWKWMPPSDWAGPSTGDSIVEEAIEKPKSTDRQGSAGKRSPPQNAAEEVSFQVPARLNHHPSCQKLSPDGSADVEQEDCCKSRSGYPMSKALKVKSFERNGWQEKGMADVIPILRKLRSK